MIEPQRAPVRPRILSPISGESVLLEDEIRSLLEQGAAATVALCGGVGGGKTVALHHLAAVFPPPLPLTLLDEPDVRNPQIPTSLSCEGVNIFTLSRELSRSTLLSRQLIVCRLAPWGDDELIEYLLAVHRERCGSVMNRLQAAGDRRLIAGVPELWRIVLDQMAADESIDGIKHALAHFFAVHFPDGENRSLARAFCLAAQRNAERPAHEQAERLYKLGCDRAAWKSLRHGPVQVMLAAELIAEDLISWRPCAHLVALPPELDREVATLVATEARALAHLRLLVGGRQKELHAAAASILHATGTGWKPEPADLSWLNGIMSGTPPLPLLAGAHLEGAVWPRIQLEGVQIIEADLSHADLTGANLDRAIANKTNLAGAKLRGARMSKVTAVAAMLAEADLTGVTAKEACFDRADLEQAIVEDARLESTSMERANLRNARFAGADLSLTNLIDAKIDGADFTGVNFEGACLTLLNLQLAVFDRARFPKADLTKCNLEEMSLPRADFSGADLSGAVLTASNMPAASSRGAKLCNTGLADIDWEGADLRDADLRGATFHMGSSRSGKVGSPIASEGSRTGFYTDEYSEQEFKSPEEIRKANLCGADLRGANIDGVDFYLVDLRRARYDADHAEHLRRCRAILEDRV